jgi:hypothetical protein
MDRRVPRLELSKAGSLEDLLEVLRKVVKTAEAFLDDLMRKRASEGFMPRVKLAVCTGTRDFRVQR